MDPSLDYMMDEILGPVEVVAENLLPVLETEPGQRFEKRAHYIKNEEGQIVAGFDVDYWLNSMRMWKRNGESVETFISGCVPEWQSDLRKIAREENLL